MSFSYAIALTGGIASGKSTVASLLRLYGYCVICADEISHQILKSSAKEVIEVFGNGILNEEDSTINRKKLGEIVFSNKEKRQKLESILHPKIRAEITSQAQVQERKGIPYFIDIPLFFETNHYSIKHSLVIYTTKELQIQRLKTRNAMSEQDALKRIESQMPLEQKRTLASDVIENLGTLEELQSAVESYLNGLQKLKI